MTHFLDGPAAGKNLMLKRTPIFLRAVVDEAGKWDALNELGDKPLAGETCYAYRTPGPRGTAHVNMGRKGGGFYPITDYTLVPEQPSQEVMRDEAAWAEWCQETFDSTST